MRVTVQTCRHARSAPVVVVAVLALVFIRLGFGFVLQCCLLWPARTPRLFATSKELAHYLRMILMADPTLKLFVVVLKAVRFRCVYRYACVCVFFFCFIIIIIFIPCIGFYALVVYTYARCRAEAPAGVTEESHPHTRALFFICTSFFFFCPIFLMLRILP